MASQPLSNPLRTLQVEAERLQAEVSKLEEHQFDMACKMNTQAKFVVHLQKELQRLQRRLPQKHTVATQTEDVSDDEQVDYREGWLDGQAASLMARRARHEQQVADQEAEREMVMAQVRAKRPRSPGLVPRVTSASESSHQDHNVPQEGPKEKTKKMAAPSSSKGAYDALRGLKPSGHDGYH